MTVGDLIKNKDYDYISYRMPIPDRLHDKIGIDSIFIGEAMSKDGKLYDLDGDTYYEDEEIISYEEWSNPDKDIVNGLTVVVGKGNWL